MPEPDVTNFPSARTQPAATVTRCAHRTIGAGMFRSVCKGQSSRSRSRRGAPRGVAHNLRPCAPARRHSHRRRHLHVPLGPRPNPTRLGFEARTIHAVRLASRTVSSARAQPLRAQQPGEGHKKCQTSGTPACNRQKGRDGNSITAFTHSTSIVRTTPSALAPNYSVHKVLLTRGVCLAVASRRCRIMAPEACEKKRLPSCMRMRMRNFTRTSNSRHKSCSIFIRHGGDQCHRALKEPSEEPSLLSAGSLRELHDMYKCHTLCSVVPKVVNKISSTRFGRFHKWNTETQSRFCCFDKF